MTITEPLLGTERGSTIFVRVSKPVRIARCASVNRTVVTLGHVAPGATRRAIAQTTRAGCPHAGTRSFAPAFEARDSNGRICGRCGQTRRQAPGRVLQAK